MILSDDGFNPVVSVSRIVYDVECGQDGIEEVYVVGAFWRNRKENSPINISLPKVSNSDTFLFFVPAEGLNYIASSDGENWPKGSRASRTISRVR